MLDTDALFHSPMTLILVLVLIIAALAHGVLGFGFPIISTPIVATMIDIKSAILLTLFPNIVVNLISIAMGGNWRSSIGKYWPVPIYVLVGTVAGTRILLIGDPELLKLLLAVMIVAYLQQARFRRLDWSVLQRYPRSSAQFFGLFAGFLAGSVNVAVPPLVIYFEALGLSAVPMTQILNLCFLVGKSTQALTFGISGKIGTATLIASVPLTVVSVAALAFGLRIRDRLHPEVYRRLLHYVLWGMAVILVLQVGWHYLG